MKLTTTILFAFSIPLLMPLARGDAAGVTVTATVQPGRLALADVKKNSTKATTVTVTYTITNHTAETQILNRFDSLRTAISGDDGRQILLVGMGRDGLGIQRASDIFILAPGKQQTLQIRVFLYRLDNGIKLERDMEDGEGLGGALPDALKFIDIGALYVNPLTRDQIEKLRPELKGAKYSLPDLKLPSVRVAFAQ